MNALRLRLQPFVWIALVAMLALALMPTLSRALASVTSSAAEHCDMPAMAAGEHAGHQAQAAADAPPSSHHGAGHLEHCPFCALSYAAVGLPPAPAATAVLPLGATALPALFLHAPRTLFAWRSAQPRAPPLNA